MPRGHGSAIALARVCLVLIALTTGARAGCPVYPSALSALPPSVSGTLARSVFFRLTMARRVPRPARRSQPLTSAGSFTLGVRFNLTQPSYVVAVRVYQSALQLAGGNASLLEWSSRRTVDGVTVPPVAAAGWVTINFTAPTWLERGTYVVAFAGSAYSYTDTFVFAGAAVGNVRLLGERSELQLAMDRSLSLRSYTRASNAAACSTACPHARTQIASSPRAWASPRRSHPTASIGWSRSSRTASVSPGPGQLACTCAPAAAERAAHRQGRHPRERCA
jgi:hypothetical protein